MGESHKQVALYDTTLRDGCQTEGISLSLEDKLQLACALDRLGVDYIEGGYPLSNPKDKKFFEEARSLDLEHSRLAAFGSTRRPNRDASEDRGLQALLETEAPAVTIVAKVWPLHVEKVLKVSPGENLKMVEDSVRFLKDEGREVIFDAEHFFDAHGDDAEYAIEVLQTAAEAGADCVVLCDTNGGTLTSEIEDVTRKVCETVDAEVGIHCHDDSGLGVANSVAAVQAGCRHVQGTLNGFGERCGNADLCAVIPNLNLKTEYRCTTDEQQKKLTEISRLAYEVANLMFRGDQPYVGHSAFAHKGGLHVDAMRKERRSYEHIDPELVGNERRFLIGELSGKASLLEKMEKYDLSHDSETLSRLLERLQRMENRGYQFEAAEASFELLAKKETGNYRRFFECDGYHVSIMRQPEGGMLTDATVKLNVKGSREHTASEGDGPVDALDGALRKALDEHYPSLGNVHLTDYKVRVINPRAATAAKVRVIVQSSDDSRMWGTVGVSENIIEASWEALVDSIEYKLLLEEEKEQERGAAAE